MNSIAQLENRASRSRSKHEGESSTALCDRHNRTRDFSQRQLPTDQDYAVSTREYQTDQSSLKPAPTAAGPVLDQRQKQRQQQKQPHRCAEIDRITPYQSTFGITVDSGAPSIPRFFERNGWDTNKVLVYIILENAIAIAWPPHPTPKTRSRPASSSVAERPPGPASAGWSAPPARPGSPAQSPSQR